MRQRYRIDREREIRKDRKKDDTMIIWKKWYVDSDLNWVLIDESDDTEVIAYITVSENSDGTCNAEAVCKKIGYTYRFEHLNKDKLKTVVSDLKRAVKSEIQHLRFENQKPTDRKVYKMIDSIPVWVYLKTGVEKTKINLKSSDYGKLAEILGNRVLHDILQRGGLLEIISTHFEI